MGPLSAKVEGVLFTLTFLNGNQLAFSPVTFGLENMNILSY